MSGDFQTELFYLKWNNFQKNVSTQFEKLRESDDLVDITFACDGKLIGAHKLVLFACSPYFKSILKKNPCQHPVFYMNDVKFEILKAILQYMYLGEVHLSNENLKEFIKTAESLQIRGLTSKDSNHSEEVEPPTAADEDDEVQVRTANSNAEDLIVFDDYCRKRQYSITEPSVELKKLKVQKADQEQMPEQARSEKGLESEECNSSSDSGEQLRHNLSETTVQISNSPIKPVEMKIEMLEEYTNQQQQQTQQQQQQQQQTSPAYCNMDSFTEKGEVKTITDTTNRPSTSTYHIHPAPVQQQQQQQTQQQLQPPTPQQYKIDDEIWLETTLLHNSSTDSISKKRSISNSPPQTQGQQQLQNKSQNCLTPRSCPLCSRVYSNVSNLRQHMRLVHHPTTVQCPICRKSFNSNLYLKRHYSTMHNADEKTWLDNMDASPTPQTHQILVMAQVPDTQNLKIK